MSAWSLLNSPWTSVGRIRFRWDSLSRNFRHSQAFFRASLQVHTNAPGWDGIRTQRYPSTRPDPGFFEEDAVDHVSITEGSRPHTSPRSPSDALHILLGEGQYEDANKLRAELEELGAAIKPDYVCLQAAKFVLEWSDPVKQIDTFAAWLAMLPESESTRPPAIAEFLDVLLQKPKKHLPLITKAGIILASKGYGDLVHDQLQPVVTAQGDAGILAQFSKDVEVAIAQFVARSNQRDPLVAEFVVEDLKSSPFVEGRVDPSPTAEVSQSTASLVSPEPLDAIETSLGESTVVHAGDHVSSTEASLPLDEAPADAVFEDLTEEYATFPQPLENVKSLPRSHDALLSFVMNEQFDDANHLLDELLAVNSRIPPSHIYEAAAQHVLRTQPSSPEQIDAFTRWFSLIPDAHAAPRRRFYGTRRLIFLARATNLMAIMRFGLICARKGYIQDIYTAVLPAVFRYAQPDVSMQYISQYEAAYGAYLHNHSHDHPARQLAVASARFRSLAVKILATTGQPKVALRLLPTEDQLRAGSASPLRSSACSLLLSRLRAAAPNGRLDPEVSDLVMLSNTFSGLAARPYRDWGVVDPSVAAALMETEASIPDPELTVHVHALRKAISQNKYPHCQAIVDFLYAYHASGRTRAIAQLRRRALRNSRRWGAVWLCAEMIYYRRQRQYDQVITTFMDHFYLTGVPRAEILILLHKWGYKIENTPRELRAAMRGKLAPTPYHTALVWHALVSMAETPTAVANLYHQLKQFARGQQFEDPTMLADVGIDRIKPLTPASGIVHVDKAAFTPFVRAFNRWHGPARGAVVLSDMMRLGLRPSVYHYTELAGRFARIGDAKRACMLLDRLEAEYQLDVVPGSESDLGTESKEQRTSQDNQDQDNQDTPEAISRTLEEASSRIDYEETITDSDPDSPESNQAWPLERPASDAYEFPAPNIVLYTSMLRGFLDVKDLDAAVRLQRRIQECLPEYIFGSDPRLDAALMKLRQLKQEVERRKGQPQVMPGVMASWGARNKE
ncbi:hypothetical protein HGRIS_011676 [Hohenbuehelia grisea]|uniref:Pentatricopeptide repeat protein n=1 Tax=Hohenbuehelia grisea TaxID=104357 RepID=A0ABR3JY25_9AGAR